MGVVLACATNAPPVASSPESDIRITGPQGSMGISTRATVIAGVANLGAPVDKVWGTLAPVYEALAIPLTIADPATHTIGNQGMRAHHRLGDVRLSEYLNCGDSQGGQSADTYEVNMSVVTALTTNASGGTTITTTVDAMAKPGSFSAEFSRCATTGRLESRIVQLVEARL
jgi:hypothetical protein